MMLGAFIGGNGRLASVNATNVIASAVIISLGE
jgi:hypothetical protein